MGICYHLRAQVLRGLPFTLTFGLSDLFRKRVLSRKEDLDLYTRCVCGKEVEIESAVAQSDGSTLSGDESALNTANASNHAVNSPFVGAKSFTIYSCFYDAVGRPEGLKGSHVNNSVTRVA